MDTFYPVTVTNLTALPSNRNFIMCIPFSCRVSPIQSKASRMSVIYKLKVISVPVSICTSDITMMALCICIQLFYAANIIQIIFAVYIYRFVMIRLDYYGTYGYCFYGSSLVKHIPEYNVMVLRCYVTYPSCISYAII